MTYITATMTGEGTNVHINTDAVVFVVDDDVDGGSFVGLSTGKIMHVHESPEKIMDMLDMEQLLEVARKKL